MGIVGNIQYLHEILDEIGIRNFAKKSALKAQKEVKKLFRTYIKPTFSDIQFYNAFIGGEIKNEAELIGHFSNRSKPTFFFDVSQKHELTQLFKSLFPEQVSKTISESGRICDHKFYFFGELFDFREEIDWHYDVISKRNWPKLYYGKIYHNKSRNRVGDIKYPWELNRHQYFTTLGKAYWLTGDEKYAEEFTNQIISWIDANPIEIGINWISAMEFGIRIISWTLAFYFFKDSKYFQEHGYKEFFKSLYVHAKFLRNNLSPGHELRNNHTIGEVAGLILMGIMFPEFKESEEWLKTGIEILSRESEKQIYPDGVDYEQSTSYQRFVIDFYLIVVILAQNNQIELPKVITECLERMLEFVMNVTKPDGNVPCFGDADDGRGFKFAEKEVNKHGTALSIGAVLFNRSDFKAIAGEFDEEAFWLLGEHGLKQFQDIESVLPKNLSKDFPHGGYYIMRSGWNIDDLYLALDCGYTGLGPNGHGGHGHNDTLSFELYAYGKSFLVDSGTYTYLRDDKIRNRFRSTVAHNTVMIDSLEMADFGSGLFKIKNQAKPILYKWESTDTYDFFDGAHTGYQRLPDAIIHRRQILFVKPKFWVVHDILDGVGEHLFELLFHFALMPLSLEPQRNIAYTEEAEGANLYIIPLRENETISSALAESWISFSYGVKHKGFVLKYSKRCAAPTDFLTLLYPVHDVTDFDIEHAKSESLEYWMSFSNGIA